MKTVAVSPRAKTLNELLKRARRGTVVLESADGQRFALTAISDWDGFDVGETSDFAEEVAQTAKNKRLMKELARRRKNSSSEKTPLAEVRKRLRLGPSPASGAGN